MRYDDRLATVLSGADGGARGRVTRWRQVIDLLAQQPASRVDPATRDAFRWLTETRAEIPLPERMAAARAVAGRPIPTDLLLFFAGDSAAVAAPVVRRARLPAETWLAILPRLGPTARALLRHRDDLPAAVARALESFGAADLVLAEQNPPAEPVPEPPVADAKLADVPNGPLPEPTGQIRQLVERIEAFRQQREADRLAPAPTPVTHARPFRWECGVDGLLSWTDLDRRGAVIGHALGGDGETGTARAFAARRPFRDAPARLPALGPVLLSGVPVFTGRSGRFTGYRGTGRAAHAPSQVPAAPPEPLAVREMVHELRTPLNAIMGFAEMIAGEYLGPAATAQRDRADEIRGQAEHLQQVLEDLDLAARLQDRDAGEDSSDLQDILIDEHAALDARARERGVVLALRSEPGLPAAAIGGEVARRLLRRLIGGAVARAGQGSVVQLAIRRDGEDAIAIEATRPPDASEADPAARLIRTLAEGAGGTLRAEPGLWVVSVPAERAAAFAA